MEKIYRLLKKVPKGRVTTYKELGKAAGLHPRAVGILMRKNPYKGILCYKVVCSNGKIGGYAKGTRKKIKMLRAEGIEIKNGKIKDFKKKLFLFR